MLEVNKQSIVPDREADSEFSSPAEALTNYLKIFRRQFPIILLIIACTTALGLIYLFTATPKFTATARMVIDTHKFQLFQQQGASLGDIAIDPAMTETQVEILKSENISLAVIKDLHLTDDPEFVGPGGGLVSAVFGLVSGIFSSDEPKSDFELTRGALARFEKLEDIKRAGLTYVMDINFTSVDAEKAARIANVRTPQQ